MCDFQTKMFLTDEIIDEISKEIGLDLWDNRDKTKRYCYPGNRVSGELRADDYFNTSITLYKNVYLLMFRPEGHFKGSNSEYTLNLNTLKPTKNSHIKKELSDELITKIKNYLDNHGRVKNFTEKSVVTNKISQYFK